jgi:hypothetical protein
VPHHHIIERVRGCIGSHGFKVQGMSKVGYVVGALLKARALVSANDYHWWFTSSSTCVCCCRTSAGVSVSQ